MHLLGLYVGDFDLAGLRTAFFKDENPIEVKALPRTIQDAITVVRRLGETYLWTDIVYIDQDDPKDVDAQVQQMYRSYEAALCTLVALDGSNAHSGLPGVRVNSRNDIGYPIRIDGANLMAGPYFPLSQAVENSRWWQRRWTLREVKSFCVVEKWLGGRRLMLSDIASIVFGTASTNHEASLS